MNRLLVRTAIVAFGAALSAGCSSVDTASTAAPAAPQSADADSASPQASLAANLDSEIRHAQLQRVQGDYEGASRALSQLMLIAPDDARVVGEYGKALAQRGASNDAVAFLKRAVQLNPNDWTTYSALGVAYDQLDDRANAKLAYTRALALNPGEPVVLNNMAVSQMLAGNYDNARQLLAEAAPGAAANPKIDANLKMVADLEASKPARASALAPRPVIAAAKPAATQAPVSIATLDAPAATKPAPQSAHGAVIMQKVPVDPMAGPVATATHPPRKLAVEAPAKPHVAVKIAKAKKPADKEPSLRTAAD